MKFLLLALTLTFTSFSAMQAQLQSPDQFLGYELGTAFTPHHKVLSYAQHIAKESDRVTIEQIGESYGGRELVQIVVTLEKHQRKIEDIRLNNLRRARMETGAPATSMPSVVWLSYNVHGNEASSSEAAMKTLYYLANPQNPDARTWLNNTVVVIDPMLNPDGRDRYVHWYNNTKGRFVDVKEDAREHHMSWPGGRTNYYYFDMNRDWAWQTQQETRARVQAYQKWMPQIHVDFHEQGFNSPYYYAPAAEPFHTLISDWQREFQFTIGENHNRYFDDNNWLYFTREVFDLFYPSYGDTWPTFNGAIGMTYEQAGIRAGLGIITESGDTLTLKDRVEHHFVTGLSTIETASKNHDSMVAEFEEYFKKSVEKGLGNYRSFLIKHTNDSDKLNRLAEYLTDQKINFYEVDENEKVVGRDYTSTSNKDVQVRKGDWIIPVRQPKSALISVLFEPNPQLVDSLTYDITAWALPYVYGLDAYALNEDVKFTNSAPVLTQPTQNNDQIAEKDIYAYVSDYSSFEDVRFLADLFNHNIKVRTSGAEFTIGGTTYQPGALFITQTDNQANLRFSEVVENLAQKHRQNLEVLQSGFIQQGVDVGSGNIHFLKKPTIAVLTGDGTSSSNSGEIWHYFDRQIEFPVTLLDINSLYSVNWYDYDVLILPDGNYGDVLSSSRLDKIKNWVNDGGKLIAVSGAIRSIVNAGSFGSLKMKEPSITSEANLTEYNQANRERISNITTGSIFSVDVDHTHPLGYGFDEGYYSLKLGITSYDYLTNGWNVGRITSQDHVSGFIGYKAKEKIDESVIFATEDYGNGTLVYLVDNPLFRAFWYDGKQLFGNAVFMVGR
jgi:hypothetical protein